MSACELGHGNSPVLIAITCGVTTSQVTFRCVGTPNAILSDVIVTRP
jgi:hypothetical protein